MSSEESGHCHVAVPDRFYFVNVVILEDLVEIGAAEIRQDQRLFFGADRTGWETHKRLLSMIMTWVGWRVEDILVKPLMSAKMTVT